MKGHFKFLIGGVQISIEEQQMLEKLHKKVKTFYQKGKKNYHRDRQKHNHNKKKSIHR